MNIKRSEEEAILGQIAYYDARAEEFDRLAPQNANWVKAHQEAIEALPIDRISGYGLEIACGTGLFTEHIAPYCSGLDAIDTSAKSLQLNKERVKSEKINYIQANILNWQPQRKYEFIFFSLWLCHVPPSRFSDFWNMLAKAIQPGRSVVFIDKNSRGKSADDFQDRKHTDGNDYRIVLTTEEPHVIEKRIIDLGWEGYCRGLPAGLACGCFALSTNANKKMSAEGNC